MNIESGNNTIKSYSCIYLVGKLRKAKMNLHIEIDEEDWTKDSLIFRQFTKMKLPEHEAHYGGNRRPEISIPVQVTPEH